MSDMQHISQVRYQPTRRKILRPWTHVPLDENGLPLERTLCPRCFGSGTKANCLCRGSGRVCPHCRGFRLVRREFWDGDEMLSETVPCPSCTDWHQRSWETRFDDKGRFEYTVDTAKELSVIAEWRREHGYEDE